MAIAGIADGSSRKANSHPAIRAGIRAALLAVLVAGCAPGPPAHVREKRVAGDDARRAIAQVASRFATLGNTQGCRILGTKHFEPFCRAFVSWSHRPLDFARVGAVTVRADGTARAALEYRSGGWIGLELIRRRNRWMIDSETTAAQLDAEARGTPLDP